MGGPIISPNLADKVGFEPTNGEPLPGFKAGAFSLSATCPCKTGARRQNGGPSGIRTRMPTIAGSLLPPGISLETRTASDHLSEAICCIHNHTDTPICLLTLDPWPHNARPQESQAFVPSEREIFPQTLLFVFSVGSLFQWAQFVSPAKRGGEEYGVQCRIRTGVRGLPLRFCRPLPNHSANWTLRQNPVARLLF